MVTLSFQSQVVAGHVGNSAARNAFALLCQPLWEVPTVLLSNHPAGRSATGQTVDLDEMKNLVDGLFDNGLADQINRIVSGYLGHEDQAEVVLSTLDRLEAAGHRVDYILDPVIGSRAAGRYRHPAIENAARTRLLPKARIVTPNHFELECLIGDEASDDGSVWRAAAALQSHGPETVIVTSVETHETSPDHVRTFLLSGDRRWIVRTPRIDSPAHGAGDLMTAAFVAHLASGKAVEVALARAVSGVFGVLSATGAQLDLAAATYGREIVNPARVFEAMPLPS